MMLIWNRLRYVLSPQFDIYEVVSDMVRGRIADVGFGTGFGTHLYSRNGREICGYEKDENAIRFAERVFRIPKLYFKYGDIERGIDDNPYEFITMIDVIEHLDNPGLGLLNIKKIMAKGGTAIISTPNKLSRYRKSEDHIVEYGPRDFERLLKQVFANVSVRDYKLENVVNKYENPLVAICRNE